MYRKCARGYPSGSLEDMDALDESNWVGSPIKTALGCLTDNVGAIAAVASTQGDLLIKKAPRLPVRFVSTVPGTSPY